MFGKQTSVVLGHTDKTELTIELEEVADTELDIWHLKLHLDYPDADHQSTLTFFSCSAIIMNSL